MAKRKRIIKEIPPQSIASIYSLPQPPVKKAENYIKEADQTWVYSAVRLISTDLASIKLHLFKKKLKAKEWVTDEILEHEALSLIQNPNPFYTGDHLLKLTSIYRELAGEAYWVFIRSGDGKIVQIWPLRPDWVKVKASKEKFIEHYTYGPISGQEVTFKAEDVLAFKDPNPTNPYRGKGAVQAASLVIDIDTFSDEWNRNFFFNSALPYLIFKSTMTPSDEEKERFLKEITAKFGGRKNAHKVLALWGEGWEVDRFGANIAELDFINSKKMLRDEILAAFHVSKANIGIVDDVNRANMEASERRFQQNVILPRMKSFVTHLNQFFLPNWPKEGIFFDFDNPVPEDTERKLAIYKSALGEGGAAPWMTMNEVRELENLPPVEGGDQIYMPFSLTPVGGVVGAIRGFFGKSKDKEEGIITLKVKGKRKREFMLPIPPRRLKEIRKEAAEKKIQHNLYKLANLIIREKHKNKKKGKEAKRERSLTLSEKQQEVFWKGMIAKTNVFENKMKELLRRTFDEQEKEVINRLEAKRAFLGRTKALNLFPPMAEEIKRWVGMFSPFIREVVQDKGREIFGWLGVGGPELELGTPRIQRYLLKDGLKFVKQCNETTKAKLRKSLAEGLAEKEGIPQLKKRIEKIFIEARGTRAEMIARTEVIQSTNFATVEGYIQSGIVKRKEWLLALDERTCEFCLAMAEKHKEANVAGDFIDGGTSLIGSEGGRMNIELGVREPPLHVMCRCTVIPVFG